MASRGKKDSQFSLFFLVFCLEWLQRKRNQLPYFGLHHIGEPSEKRRKSRFARNA